VPIQLVVGLGNPGDQYRGTRHNVGFEVAGLLAVGRWQRGYTGRWAQARVRDRSLLVLRPVTYMNRSGISVRQCVRRHRLAPDEVLVIHDDLDLPLGRLRLRPCGGSGGHRGVESVGRELGSFAFPRLRIGIGRPPEGWASDDYVLCRFAARERSVLRDVLSLAVRAVGSAAVCGVEMAMNRYNGCDLTPAEG